MGLTEIVYNSKIAWEKAVAIPDSGTALTYDFDIYPEDFLEYAELDIQNDDSRGIINALSNSKRAIDCSVEQVMKIFSLTSKYNNFPSKLDLLQEIGVIAPRIVGKVNKNRNFLEHSFKMPSKEDVQDALDIATLFIHSVNGLLGQVWIDFYIKEGPDRDPFSPLKNVIHFGFDESKKNNFNVELFNEGKKEKIIVNSDDKFYKTLIKLMLSIERNVTLEKVAINELIQTPR